MNGTVSFRIYLQGFMKNEAIILVTKRDKKCFNAFDTMTKLLIKHVTDLLQKTIYHRDPVHHLRRRRRLILNQPQ
jgi:hypothetical protein